MDKESIRWSKTGVPQGSIVSPILANIYYHELDEFVQKIKVQQETPEGNRKNFKSQNLTKNFKTCDNLFHIITTTIKK